jgi:mannose-6-phosphate isomerase-like protein (cupin superfamily)
MTLSRRELALLLPALVAPQAAGRANTPLSQTFRNEDIPPSRNGTLVSRPMLKAPTHTGYLLDLHESELAVGDAPHAPHQHVHEELLLIREGLLDITIAGTSTRLGPGSAAYLASNQLHGWKNVGTTTARYFVLALGDDNA